MKAVPLFAASVLALGFVAPAHADDWAVSRIQYSNEGSYVVAFAVDSEDRDGKTVPCEVASDKPDGLAQGQSATIRVSDADGSPSKKCPVMTGFEVWGLVSIADIKFPNGYTDKSCRKDKARYFAHPDGGTLKVFSKGTSKDNNRCRIRSNGGVRWDKSVHGANIYQQPEESTQP